MPPRGPDGFTRYSMQPVGNGPKMLGRIVTLLALLSLPFVLPATTRNSQPALSAAVFLDSFVLVPRTWKPFSAFAKALSSERMVPLAVASTLMPLPPLELTVYFFTVLLSPVMRTPSPTLFSTPLLVSGVLLLPAILKPIPWPVVPRAPFTRLELPVIQKPIAFPKERTFWMVCLVVVSILYPATVLPVAWTSFVRPPFAPGVMSTTGRFESAAVRVMLQPTTLTRLLMMMFSVFLPRCGRIRSV